MSPAVPPSHAVAVAAASGNGQDRAAVFERPWGLVAVLADGAGGCGDGRDAAEAIIDMVRGGFREPHGRTACGVILREMDEVLSRRRGGGRAAAVVLVIAGERISGASVGDTVAWLYDAQRFQDLTRAQTRRPLLGSGWATPVSFEGRLRHRSLLLASDGLWRYAKVGTIAEASARADLGASALAIRDLARMPSGGLHDDVSVVLIRRQ